MMVCVLVDEALRHRAQCSDVKFSKRKRSFVLDKTKARIAGLVLEAGGEAKN